MRRLGCLFYAHYFVIDPNARLVSWFHNYFHKTHIFEA